MMFLLCYVRVEETLQQNEIMNVFYDDWMSLTAEDGSFGSKADNHLKVVVCPFSSQCEINLPIWQN